MSLNFVSESAIEEARKKRQEEWDRVRKPSDPVEAPEAPQDHRTLYERLKEQRDRKQEERDEERKLKNCIKGLEDDEAEFLQDVDEQKAILKNEKYEEEFNALEEFKTSRINNITDEQDQMISEAKKQVLGITSGPVKKAPQTNRLSNLIKRKLPASSSFTTSGQKPTDNSDPKDSETSPKKPKTEPEKETTTEQKNPLSSLLGYDDSDSESE